MNNQMPYMGPMPSFNPLNNNLEMQIDKINNRLSRIEKQIRILENRINNMNTIYPTFLKNNNGDNDNMYML